MSLSGWAVRVAAVVVASAGLGVLAAIVWFAVVTLPSYVIQPDGRATLSQTEVGELFAIDAWFTVIGLVGGLAIGVSSWIVLRRLDWAVSVVALVGGLVAATACLMVAGWLGPGELEPRLAAANPGAEVPVAFALQATSAVAIWPFGALVVTMIGSAFTREER